MAAAPPPPTTGTCASCANSVPRPILTCFECGEHGSSANTPAYCSTKCLSEDRDSHRGHCGQGNVLQSIYRAGDLLQSAFYLWRRLGFDVNVKDIRKSGEALTLKEEISLVPHGQSILFDFPDHLVPEQNDKHKLLTFLACSDASAYMYELVKKALQDTSTTIEEVRLKVPSSEVHIKRYYAHNGDYDRVTCDHEVIAIDCHNGHSYVIDLAGAQYGQYQAVTPLEEYLRGKLGEIERVDQHGYMAAVKKQCILGSGPFSEPNPQTGGQCDTRILLTLRELYGVFNAAVNKWEERQSMSISDLLNSKDIWWQRGKEQLLVGIERKMRAWIDNWKAAGCPCITLSLSEQELSAEEEQLLKPQHAAMGDREDRSTVYRNWVSQKARNIPVGFSLEA
ncbi:hypothetical protein AC579_1519 [Pseudocercospora musae]|uniref:Suppressor of anucleate metulae protein B n=1 Tax=Pseudocercospora musae TaxID=113226 RepID=A0A139IMF4_9PEZI|nr:hypothetical protein AC579_1519 [Pseudocercospora musae]